LRLVNKIPAGALQLVVFIGVVIAIILASFVTLAYVNMKFSKQTNLLIDTVDYAKLGIQIGLVEDYPIRDTIPLSFEDTGLENLKLYKNSWGIYETLTTVSSIKKNKIINHAFIGSTFKKNNRTGLYLADDQQPLVVVGNTYISGKNYLPKQGIKPGIISGVRYYDNQLAYGKTSESEQRLPTLSFNITSEIYRLRNVLNEIDAAFIESFSSSLSLKNSFKENLKILYSTEAITLENASLIGHIVIFSDTKITVNESSSLHDVILVAPKIEIQSNFKGNLQAIASENISLGDNTILKYPSALVLYNENVNNSEVKERNVVLSKNTQINGQIIVVLPKNKLTKYEPQLKLNNNTIVNGEVYCNQNVEHLGTVNGSLYAKRFISKQAGSVYINHIYNGRIDAKGLSADYVGLNFEKPSGKKIMKWGY